jgi:hypothetical protein
MTRFAWSAAVLLGVACSSSNQSTSGPNPALGGSTGSGGAPLLGGSPGTGGASPAATGGSGGKLACASLAGLDASCGMQATEAQFRPVSILLVVDKSSSMSLGQDVYNLSKWQALRMALNQAIGQVTAGVAIGLELFPSPAVTTSCSGVDCCAMPDPGSTVEVPVAIGTAAQIQSILGNTSPGGATPTAEALRRAGDYFANGAGAGISGQKIVLLATDGAPNCGAATDCGSDKCTLNIESVTGCAPAGASCCTTQGVSCLDDAATLAAVAALTTAGISTVVVGIPGSEAYVAVLESLGGAALAPAPGVSSYYQISTTAGLQGLEDTIQAITTNLVKSCEVPLDKAPDDPARVNVAVDCQVVTKDMADGSGWHLDQSTNPPTLVLEGQICAQITGQGVQRIDTVFGCPTVN